MKLFDKHDPDAPKADDAFVDPVCHMVVEPGSAAGKSQHDGTVYYFCAPGCKKAFDADPAKFLAGGGGPHHMH